MTNCAQSGDDLLLSFLGGRKSNSSSLFQKEVEKDVKSDKSGLAEVFGLGNHLLQLQKVPYMSVWDKLSFP